MRGFRGLLAAIVAVLLAACLIAAYVTRDVHSNQTAARLGAEELGAMRRHFLVTSRYEWMFWNMGYRLERWPV